MGFSAFLSPADAESPRSWLKNRLANLPSERVVINGERQLREVSRVRMGFVPPRGGPVVERRGNRLKDAGRLSKSGARRGSRRVLQVNAECGERLVIGTLDPVEIRRYGVDGAVHCDSRRQGTPELDVVVDRPGSPSRIDRATSSRSTS